MQIDTLLLILFEQQAFNSFQACASMFLSGTPLSTVTDVQDLSYSIAIVDSHYDLLS
jgi:hypothetical protein